MGKVKAGSLKDIKPHARNANRGTERGAHQLEESVKRFGLGRSIVVDKNDIVIAGNHALEAAGEAGVQKITVVETRGDELVVVKRVDLDLASDTDKRAVGLAVADNRTAETGLEWDADILEAEIREGLDLSAFFKDSELDEILKKQADEEEKASSGGAGASENMVKLVFTPEDFAEFTELSVKLMRLWNVNDAAPAVLEAMRRAARAA